ncbi:efflux RND transporter permease subunit [Angelakisella massiliensis]|uniref:efflux RND transporter permease subunit n=1 Tax=Angelakisella massiliensis TaxID=1871018 RepID=UPI0009764302|nr:efflux RND transporter permease subunit [Angelakisella massiliensis]
MNLTKLTMRRPVSVFIILLALIVFGVQAMLGAPLELIPEMEMPIMIVMSSYPGAGPEEVEEMVTSVLESAVSTMSGVETIQSVSQEGMAMLALQFSYGTDMDVAHMDLQKKLDMYSAALPDTATDPTIIEMSMDAMATITMSVKATGDVDLLNYVDDTIVPEFEKISGVASVDVSGGQKDYISVCLREDQMNQYGLDMSQIVSAMSSADFSLPAGTADRGSAELTIRGGVTYDSVESLRQMPITTATGGVIHLSDVADVYEAKRPAESISRYNGEETVTLSVTKRQSASTLDVSRGAISTMESINSRQMGVEISVINDSSEQIISSIQTVISTLILGIILSMVVLFIFFGEWRASLIVGSSMPISVLTTIILMNGMGFSFNIISLGGLVIGVGMMVDNSIVVLESCFRHREQKMSFQDSALEGARVVTNSIIASTITTIVVFLPISIMQGMTGQLFKQLGFTIIFSLIASLLSALTLVPLLFCRIEPREKEDIWVTRVLHRTGEAYGRFLKKLFPRKKLVVFISVALLVISFVLLSFVPMELIPSIDQGTIDITVETRPGLKLENVDAIATSLEEMIQAHPDVDRYSVNGSSGSLSISVYLKGDRQMTTDEVVNQWRQETADTVDYTVSVSSYNMADMMSGGGSVQLYLESTDRDQLKDAAEQVLAMMRESDSIIKASSDLTDGNPQAEIVVDPVKASAAGLSPYQVVSTVSNVMDGKNAMTITDEGTQYEVWVEYPEDQYETVSDLSGLTIMSATGKRVPLLDVAEITYSNAPQSITKIDNMYVVTITGQPTTEARLTATQEIYGKVAQMDLPTGVQMRQGSSAEAMNEEFSAMGSAILSAVFLVFMVMAMQFESARFSLVVMLCIPFSLIGSFGALFLTGVTLSMPSLMGLLMLVGIVVNNGILFIDTTNQLRSSMDAETALIYAGKTRMRPILMTTLTTVLSMVPMALGIGDGSEIMQGMAVIIIGGLCASTLLTLLLLPNFYLLMSKKDPREKKRRGLFRRKKKEQQEEKGPDPHQYGVYDNAFVEQEGLPPELSDTSADEPENKTEQ